MSSPRLCVIQPNRSSYSESFVHAHVERLPATTLMLYGGWFPTRHSDGQPLLPVMLGQARNNLARLPAKLRRALCLAADLALAAFLRRAHIDVVLAEYGPTGAEVMRACALTRTPFIVHFHGVDAFQRELLTAYAGPYRAMFRAARRVIAVSRLMEQRLADLGAPADRLLYLPYGADCVLFTPGRPETNPPHFLAAGRFVDKKAPQLALLAFQRVHAAIPEARLTMVGDGPLLEACKSIARGLGLDQAVSFPGPLPQQTLAALMRQSRAFVQHSVTSASGDAEGTPVVILEAGAAGLPVVATRHSGIADVVIEGKTGLLVDEGDVAGMAAHMLSLTRSPLLAAQLGRRAAEHIRTSYNQHRQLARLWEVLDAARRSTHT